MLLILLRVAGTVLILPSTSRYGAGLSPDSVGNVAACTAFLIAASTTTAYDRIGDRLLSPVYIPATLLLLILAETLVVPFRKHRSLQVVKGLLIRSRLCVAEGGRLW